MLSACHKRVERPACRKSIVGRPADHESVQLSSCASFLATACCFASAAAGSVSACGAAGASAASALAVAPGVAPVVACALASLIAPGAAFARASTPLLIEKDKIENFCVTITRSALKDYVRRVM